MSSSSSTKSIQKHLEGMSFFEKLGILPKLIYTLASTVAAVVGSTFRGKAVTTTRQQHFLVPPTDDGYRSFCEKFKLQPESETLADGTTAHWVGPKTASNLIVYFHGGGYVIPAGIEMFECQYRIQQKISKPDKEVAVILLAYDLAPIAKYPRQLEQATALVDYLINTLSKKPSNIVFAGDSAGANLITQLLSHISHPHPSVPALSVTEKFRGACLISPWVDFSTATSSMKKNKYQDFLSIAAGTQWSSAFMTTDWPHKDSTDFYNQAATAPKGWWDEVQVDEIFIVGGEDEILIDGIKKFGETLKQALGDRVTTVYIKNQMHDQALIDLMIGYKESGPSAQAITNWLGSKL